MKLRPCDILCEPSPSDPAETLVADGWRTYLLFNAVSKDTDESGQIKDIGVAVLECQNCALSKFGYPNDEGLPEHPLFQHGILALETSVIEVEDSTWTEEISGQQLASARRIWGGRGMSWDWAQDPKLRHFVILMKEKTFECVCSSLVVQKFCATFDEAFSHVIATFNNH